MDGCEIREPYNSLPNSGPPTAVSNQASPPEVFKYPSEQFVSILESQNYIDNNTLLIKMAKKIGFNIPAN